jgi:hypothetical protein
MDDSGRAPLLNDSVKLRSVVGDETDAFNQYVINAPAGWKFYKTIDN